MFSQTEKSQFWNNLNKLKTNKKGKVTQIIILGHLYIDITPSSLFVQLSIICTSFGQGHL